MAKLLLWPGPPILRLAQRSGKVLQDQLPDLSAVGPALGLPHHGPDQRSQRPHVPPPHLLGRGGIGRDRPADGLLETVAQRSKPALSDDLPRAPASIDERVEDLPGGVPADLP